MDLASIDLQAAAEEGVEVKLQHPANGEYLVDDEGEHLTIVILGKDSQTWQNAAKRVNTRMRFSKQRSMRYWQKARSSGARISSSTVRH
jgi:hypothetical protein